MTFLPPTQLDVTRAILDLDEHATGHPDKSIDDMRQRVARNLGYAFERGSIGASSTNVIVAMVAHGATPFTCEQHASAIAQMMRDGKVMH